jgi:hypothetical protein
MWQMITEYDCGDCGLALRTVPLTPADEDWVAELRKLADGPTTSCSWPAPAAEHCGSATATA